MPDIIASTGDIQKDYSIVGLTSYYFSTYSMREPKKITDIFDFIIEELKKDAVSKGADAIVNIRVDFEQSSAPPSSFFFAYGTLVKFT